MSLKGTELVGVSNEEIYGNVVCCTFAYSLYSEIVYVGRHRPDSLSMLVECNIYRLFEAS